MAPPALAETAEVKPLQQASNQSLKPTVTNLETTTPASTATSEVEPVQQAANQILKPTVPNIETTAPDLAPPASTATSEVEPVQPAKAGFANITTFFRGSQGDATDGEVTQLKVDNNQPIAASETVAAMNTPGKLLNNKADKQKNLNFLEQLNKVSTAEEIVQRKTIDKNNYSSPPLIFRKANANHTSFNKQSDTPSQWSSIESLLNTGNEESNFNNSSREIGGGYNSQTNNQTFPIQQKPAYSHKALNEKRDKTSPSDISTDIKPITETIKSGFDETANSNSANSKEDDEIALEALAREVYIRLRQQLEIEKERQGTFTGRLPW